MKKRVFVRLFCIAVLVTGCLMLTACGGSGKQSVSGTDSYSVSDVDDSWYLPKEGVAIVPDEYRSDEFWKDGGFDYEKVMAQNYYSPDDGKKPAETERNQMIDAYGLYAFDPSGTGVFAVTDPALSGMNQSGFYLEYTSDKGKMWQIVDGAFHSPFHVCDVKLVGRKVYLVLSSSIYRKSYILYSDDLCRTFRGFDVVSLLPEYRDALYYHTEAMRILNIDEKDGSVIVGFYDDTYRNYSVFSEYSRPSFGERYYLIARTDSTFGEGSVLYADKAYMQSTSFKEKYE